MKNLNNMKKQQEKKIILMRKRGKIVSDKMEKTVVVSCDTYKTDRKYKKKYRSTKKYKAHDEKNEYRVGDVVEIAPCAPISKDKKFKVIGKLN